MQQSRPCCSKRVGETPECPYCKGFSIKHGKSVAQKQRYYCKQCSKTYLTLYTNKAYQPQTNKDITTHLKESNSIRSISRIIQINTKTIIRRIITIAQKIMRPPLLFGKTYEVDEQWTYISNKEQGTWIIYALCRETKKVADFVVGSNTKMNLSSIVNPLILSNPIKIYTDKLASYKTLIPKDIHSTKRGGTNHIERQNLANRTDLKRLCRRTICYSKSAALLTACLRIYFWS
ncbi:MAG: IS1 family transposase [Phycisphaerales bacterium]|nr:IS1 family transposase [Phycisphaerales bacterium]